MRSAVRSLAVCLALAVVAACRAGIWNAGDLVKWVKDRAVEQGCEPDSIALDKWYTETSEGNVWRGTCQDAQGNPKSFGIDVDPVWTPSNSAT